MTEEEIQNQYGEKIMYSLRCASSEILGPDTDKYGKYFQCHAGLMDNEPVIVVVEQVTNKQYRVAIPYSLLQYDSDESYYFRLRELAEIADPFIPEEEKDLIKDEWPEPTWQPPPEEDKDG